MDGGGDGCDDVAGIREGPGPLRGRSAGTPEDLLIDAIAKTTSEELGAPIRIQRFQDARPVFILRGTWRVSPLQPSFDPARPSLQIIDLSTQADSHVNEGTPLEMAAAIQGWAGAEIVLEAQNISEHIAWRQHTRGDNVQGRVVNASQEGRCAI